MTPRGRTLLLAGGLALAGLLAYANSFSVPFLLDDWVTIQENPRIRQVWPLWEALTPPENTGVGGRPVANLAFVLNYAVTGGSLAGYHAGNLLIHVAAALVLFGVVRRTLAFARRTPGSPDLPADLIAAGTAALWLLHPLQTQSVTYLSQRTESLMGLFYLATLYGFLRDAAGAGLKWRFLAVVAAALGMGTKEGMVTVPVAVLLIDRWFVAGSFAAAWRARRGLYLALAATWLLLPWLMTGLSGRSVGFGVGLSAWDYALKECGAVTRYLLLAFRPTGLVFDYGAEVGGPGIFEVGVVAGLVAAAAIGTLRRSFLGFGVVWFLLTLAPTSSVVPIPLQPIAENRVYVPLAGLVVVVVVAAVRYGGRAAAAGLLLAAIAAGGLTLARNADYRSEIGLWTDTVAKAPANSRARNNLGEALQRHGRYAEARTHFEAALALKPDLVEAHANLAGALGHLGQHETALRHARRALELNPANDTAAFNLGISLLNLGQLPAAEEALTRATQLRPAFAEAHASLALLLLRQGRPAEAMPRAETALELKPGLGDGRLALGGAHLQLGRLAEALGPFEAFVRDQPNHVDGRYLCGTTLLMLGRPAEAIPQLEAASRLSPDHAPAQSNLGIALARANRPAEARPRLEAALRLDPQLAGARGALEKINAGQVP